MIRYRTPPPRNLQNTVHSQAYRSRLSYAGHLFLTWVASLPRARLEIAFNSVNINALLVEFIQSLYQSGMVRHHKLATFSVECMRALFASLLKQLRLDSCGFTLGSLRPGKASDLYMEGESIERIRFAGRWKNGASLEHYIQEAQSQAVLLNIKPKLARELKRVGAFSSLFAVPPRAPWEFFFSRAGQRKALLPVQFR